MTATGEKTTGVGANAYDAGWLNGGDRFEYAAQLRLGNELRSQLQFVSVVEKYGRSGPMALLTFVTEFRRSSGARRDPDAAHPRAVCRRQR